jgi:hypothetical protein
MGGDYLGTGSSDAEGAELNGITKRARGFRESLCEPGGFRSENNLAIVVFCTIKKMTISPERFFHTIPAT